MTDVRARENLGPAFDEKTPSRRQLLRAGVWAAPVIVLATAAPAAAGSITTVTATGVNAGVSISAQGNQGKAGDVAMNMDYYYAPGQFGGIVWGNPSFSLLTTTWLVTLTRVGATTAAYSKSATVTLTYNASGVSGTPTAVNAFWGGAGKTYPYANVTPGQYVVTLTVTALPIMYNGTRYQAAPASSSMNVTVI